MSSLVKRRASTFVVDFGDVDIPSVIAKDLETEIQELALAALARIDFRGDLRIGRLPPGTYGMIFGDWPPDLFPGLPGQPEEPDIKIRDHTTIIDAVMKNGLALSRMLAATRRAGRRPSGAEVLETLIALPSVDDNVKRTTSAVLSYNKRTSEKDLPRGVKAAVAEITRQLDSAESLDDIAQMLKQAEGDERYRKVDGLPEAIRIASQILEDGRSTIYSPDHPFYEGLGSGDSIGTAAKEKGAKDVVKEDVKGGLTGGVGGAVAGPKGALVGAVGGALLGSAAEAISQLWDSIFD